MKTKLHVKKNRTLDKSKRSISVQIMELLGGELKQLRPKYSRKKDKIEIFQQGIESINRAKEKF